MISLITAMDSNRLIGKDGKLPWVLPADLAYFKEKTMGHTIVMGGKTYRSLGKPLPGREHYVITRDKTVHYETQWDPINVRYFTHMGDLDEQLNHLSNTLNQEVFIIGGAEIYKMFLPRADRLYITHVWGQFEGDTYFPEVDPKEWVRDHNIFHMPDLQNSYPHQFAIYNRRRNYP